MACTAAGPTSIWRYAALLPVPEEFQPDLPVGFTPTVRAKNLGKRIGAKNLYLKNDSVCFPTLSFKDRVVAVALANARRFGFTTVGCSSTGNLANSVAAHAARLGLQAVASSASTATTTTSTASAPRSPASTTGAL